MQNVTSQEKVTQVVHKFLEIPETPAPSEDLAALGLDSIRSIQLILSLEEKFGITFEDEDFIFDNFSTIEKIVKLIEERLA